MSKVLYTAHANSTNGRNGQASTDDGALKFNLASPGAPNAKPGTTNPEQLFACGYSACFGGALQAAAKQLQLELKEPTVHADVSLNQDDNGYFLSVTLNVSIANLDNATASKVVALAHTICPYSKATHGNIVVTLQANDEALKAA